MIKKSRWVAMAGAAGIAVAGMAADALSVGECGTIGFWEDKANWTSASGGEFGVDPFTAPVGFNLAPVDPLVKIDGSYFQTFCLEFGTPLLKFAVGEWCVSTSTDSDNDPLDPRTAYLFSLFWNGDLPDYDYTPGAGRVASAASLQNAIWVLEDEFPIGDLDGIGDTQAKAWIQLANDADPQSIGDVRILNITLDGAPDWQDVLVILQDETPPGGGGHTPGFWGNKNGQALIGADDLTLLEGLCLREKNGDDFDPASKGAVKTWLKNRDATNMAYMLSAHLAAMALNVHNGFVDDASEVYIPMDCDTFDGVADGQVTIGDLMDYANDLLCADNVTKSGDPNRAEQECIKNVLDAANNNLNWVN